MCDGQRTITTKLTEAQYDVYKYAIDETIKFWETGTTQQKRDAHTLQRALDKLHQAWTEAPRS
jgi:alkyl sulfatase BDS1-like metallo-beta-lactamase superfamily hydrolase